MRRTALVRVIAVVFFASLSAKQLAAQSSTANLRLDTNHVSAPLEILDGDAAFDCPKAMRPAKMDVVFDVSLFGNNLMPFNQIAGKRKPVVIRRGNQVTSQAEESDRPNRTDKAHYSKERVAAVSDLRLQTVFYLCELYGYPVFLRLDYLLSGHVHDYSVQFEWSIDPDNNENLDLTYSETIWRVRNHETGKYESLSYGTMRADFDLAEVPFRINEILPVLPVDLSHYLYITILSADETN